MKEFKNDAWESLGIMLHNIKRVTIRAEKNPTYEAVEIDIDRGEDYPKATVTLFGSDIEIRGIEKIREKELPESVGKMKEPESAERLTCLWCHFDTGGRHCPICGASVCFTCLDASDDPKVCPDCAVKREKDRNSRTEALREDASERRRELAAEDQRVRDTAGEPVSKV